MVKREVWVREVNGVPTCLDQQMHPPTEPKPLTGAAVVQTVRYVPAVEQACAVPAAAALEAMRDADKRFERCGGSTRHHVRDCLIPALEKRGLVVARAADAGKAQAEWVAVSERLPGVTEQVLVVRQEPGAKPWVGPAWYRGPRRSGERRRGDWEASPWGVVNDVTHWRPMPLPPPPSAPEGT